MTPDSWDLADGIDLPGTITALIPQKDGTLRVEYEGGHMIIHRLPGTTSDRWWAECPGAER